MATVERQGKIRQFPTALGEQAVTRKLPLSSSTTKPSTLLPNPAPGRSQGVLPGRSVFAAEGEDAKLTGGTRSLLRRLLALNVEGSLDKAGPRADFTPLESATKSA